MAVAEATAAPAPTRPRARLAGALPGLRRLAVAVGVDIPIGTLIVLGVLAAIAGVLAAIPPARRASKVDVLRAVTTE